MKKQNQVMSMVNPSTDYLMTKVDSRYGLVVCGAALEEIAEGKINYVIKKEQ